MTAVVVRFPGSNCDRDMAVALENLTGKKPEIVWHNNSLMPEKVDLITLPGGFSYGDYLRCGAMAANSAITPAIIAAAKRGVPIVGICNGFQILTESGLLPGALMRNAQMRFVCRDVLLEANPASSPLLAKLGENEHLVIPVAHHDGNYFADAGTLNQLEDDNRIAFRYLDNPNGSARDIAGIVSGNRRVLGMMPHPERAADALSGNTDGSKILRSILEAMSVNI